MNKGPRRASPALPHITYSLSLNHTNGTCHPLSHAGAASRLSWQPAVIFFFFLCCWCLIVSSSRRMDGALGGCSHIAAYARSSGYLNSDAPQHHFSLFFLNTFLSTVGALCISMHRWRRRCVDKWCHEYFICQRNPLERTGVIKIH